MLSLNRGSLPLILVALLCCQIPAHSGRADTGQLTVFSQSASINSCPHFSGAFLSIEKSKLSGEAKFSTADTLTSIEEFSGPLTTSEETARFLYSRLSGKTLVKDTPLYNQLVSWADLGKFREIAEAGTKETGFINSVVRQWGANILTQDKTPGLGLNDSLAFLMGSVRDNLDARTLLTGDFTYGGDTRFGSLARPSPNSNQIFDILENNTRELAVILKYYSPQWNIASLPESSGLLTTRWWASMNYSAGTNRRVIPNIMESFLCKDNGTWRRPNLPTARIRQDIDRFPQGSAHEFNVNCRTCHSIMDGLAGAFTNIDFVNEQMVWTRDIRPKYFFHSDVYPEGFVTKDNSWINYLSEADFFGDFGFEGAATGNGIRSLGTALSQTKAFRQCMAKRVFSTVCRKSVSLNDPVVSRLEKSLIAGNHLLRDLFINAVLDPDCKRSGNSNGEERL